MKNKVPTVCNGVSILLLIAFVIKNMADYSQYSSALDSAPFSLWVLVNAVFLIVPAIIVFVIGVMIKKKQ